MKRHFHVAVACCPSEEEKAWKLEGDALQCSKSGESYSFDHVLTESGGREELYERAVSPLIASALEGGHDAFAVFYGQQRTGKTHAVFGPSGQARVQKEAWGVAARIGQQVFDIVSNDRVCRVSATFCHVFEDGRVTDLFDSRRRRLDVVEDRSSTTYSLPSLTEHVICSPLDLARLTERANLMRNASGSRREQGAASVRPPSGSQLYKPHCSHAIVSVLVERLKGVGEEGEGDGEEGEGNKEGAGGGEGVRRSQITVVDLAGYSIGLVQAGQPCPDSGIDTLHQIMTCLATRGIVAAAGLFPLSSLTKLLKPCLGGNSETLLVGTLSLSETSVEDSKRCLQVLHEASQIKNYCRHSHSPLSDSSLGKTLQQIASLRDQVSASVGLSEQAHSWEVGQDSSSVKINGHTYSDLSASCSSLVQRLGKLEAQLLRNGVSSKQQQHSSLSQTPLQSKMAITSVAAAAVNSAPMAPIKPLLHKPLHTAKRKPLLPQTSVTSQQTTTDSLSSSSLDSVSSESDLEQQASEPSPVQSGPPPPPLRGIPHVKPDSTFIPPRPPSGKPHPSAWRPSSGHSHHQEHSLASSSQVSSAVSSWSEAATIHMPHPHRQDRPSSPTGSSQTSSVRHTPTPSHLHTSHLPTSHLRRPPFPLRGTGALPVRPVMPVQPVRPLRPIQVGLARPVRPPPRPVFSVPSVRPPAQEALHIPQPLHPLIISSSKKPSQPVPPVFPLPLSLLPSPHDTSTRASSPGSLTPNAGSPALTPSPSPSPPPPASPSPSSPPPSSLPPSLPPSSPPPSSTEATEPAFPLPCHAPHRLPPITTLSTAAVPRNFPSTSQRMVAGGNISSSSSSLSLTDSDLSQEARDTFDPVIRNRTLSMHRTAPPYNGAQTPGPISHEPTTEDAPPYDRGTGGGVIGDMSDYTSREEIHMAAMEGVKSSQLKKLAIQCGVDYKDHGGRTPLMYAVLGNQPRMCDTLLNLGAKVNIRDSTGLTPLLWATFQAKPQCMKTLLRHGADIHTRDSEGRSVFHWAVKSPNIQCLKTLQRHATPTIVNTADNKGLTPLHWAVLCNQPAHTHLLLTSTAADISIQDLEGRTALTHAVLNTSSSCIKVILEVSEGMVNQCDDKGRTALHYACAEGSTDCVRTLLTVRSCDIHGRDSRGTTPLHWAAAANQPSVLQLLLRRGADRSLRDSDEMTAVEHAEVRGHTECAHILHNYGLRRPSSALSVASQVSVHATPPPSLDKHGHVTLALPQRRFSLFHSSLPRPPADGQAHPENSGTDHTHGDEIPNTPTHTVQQVDGFGEENGRRGGRGGGVGWWRCVMCGCSGRNNVVMPAPVT